MPPVTLLTWAGAALPVVLLVIMLVLLRRSAVQSAVAGLAVAMLVGAVLFRASGAVLGVESLKGLWSSVSILLVIFPAIMLYEASREVGGFETIRRELTRVVPDRLLQVLALGWGFTSFLQGPSGFGVPVAVVAPLLIGIGVKPMWAVIIPLMGQAWGNTFGTLGLAWDALAQQCSPEVNLSSVALWTALFIWMLNACTGVLICWFHSGLAGLRRGWPAVLAITLVQGGGQLMLVPFSTALCNAIPATLSLAIIPLLARMPRYSKDCDAPDTFFNVSVGKAVSNERIDATPAEHTASTLSIHQAMLPYYLLVGIMLPILLIPALSDTLGTWKTGFNFPETVTGFDFVNKAAAEYSPVTWLTHSGFFLLVAVLLAGVVYTRNGLLASAGWSRIGRNTLKKSIPSAVSVALLLMMSKVMGGSGQIEVLAQGTAAVAGGFYGLLAPVVGGLGAFMSSSNVSSNILFGQFQESMARLTGQSDALILAAQTSGAAAGTMISPSKVLLGTTTAGIVGQEGEVIKRLVLPVLFLSGLMGLTVLLA